MKLLTAMILSSSLSSALCGAESPAVPVPGGLPSNALTDRVHAVRGECEHHVNRLDALDRGLRSQRDVPEAQLPERVREAEAAIEATQLELERLKREEVDAERLKRVRAKATDDLARELRTWEERLKRARESTAKAAREEAELAASSAADQEATPTLVQGVAAGGRKAVETVVFKNNLLAPIETPYFQLTQIRFRSTGQSGLKIEPRQPGLSLAAALKPGAWLAKALEKADTEKHFLAVFVAPDSIEAYYGLRAELRKRKLLHRWDTWNGEMLLTGAGGANVLQP